MKLLNKFIYRQNKPDKFHQSNFRDDENIFYKNIADIGFCKKELQVLKAMNVTRHCSTWRDMVTSRGRHVRVTVWLTRHDVLPKMNIVSSTPEDMTPKNWGYTTTYVLDVKYRSQLWSEN